MRQSQPAVTWAMIRAVTALRVCWSGVCGTLSMIEDARQLFGTGQARNRTARAVERTIPFLLACQAIAVCWYATAGHHPADTQTRRLDAPWYTSKTEPSTADMAHVAILASVVLRIRSALPSNLNTRSPRP